MTERTKRELAELGDPMHPRQDLSPMGELGLIDLAVEGQRIDEHHCLACSDDHARGMSGGVGTPVGARGPDPVDFGLGAIELGLGINDGRTEPVGTAKGRPGADYIEEELGVLDEPLL